MLQADLPVLCCRLTLITLAPSPNMQYTAADMAAITSPGIEVLTALTSSLTSTASVFFFLLKRPIVSPRYFVQGIVWHRSDSKSIILCSMTGYVQNSGSFYNRQPCTYTSACSILYFDEYGLALCQSMLQSTMNLITGFLSVLICTVSPTYISYGASRV